MTARATASASPTGWGRADAACPLRPGQPCTLCHPEAFLGPQDCPTVALVMDDDELRAELARRRAAHAAAYRSRTVATRL